MEEVPAVDLPVGDGRPVGVRLAVDDAAPDAAARQGDGPGARPVIPAEVAVDGGGSPELRHHNHQRAVQEPADVEVFEERGERFVELAELLDVEVEVLVVRVVVGVRHLDEGGPALQQPAGHQAVPAEVVLAVAMAELLGSAAGVEQAAAASSVAPPGRSCWCTPRSGPNGGASGSGRWP